ATPPGTPFAGAEPAGTQVIDTSARARLSQMIPAGSTPGASTLFIIFAKMRSRAAPGAFALSREESSRVDRGRPARETGHTRQDRCVHERRLGRTGARRPPRPPYLSRER